MKISHKLIFGFLGIMVVISVAGYFSLQISRKSLEERIAETAVLLAQETLDKIDRNIHHRLENLAILSLDLMILEVLTDSNQTFDRMTDPSQAVLERDREWVNSPQEVITPLMGDIIQNRLSSGLRERLVLLETEYGYPVFGEIVITNRYGANVAQTGKTTDYKQDDEVWWREARDKGISIGDFQFDANAGINSIDLGLRIDGPQGDFQGVMKGALNIAEATVVMDRIKAASEYKTEDLALLTADGKLIYSTKIYGAQNDFLSVFSGFQSGEGGKSYLFTRHEGEEEELYVMARSQGYKKYPGLGWTLVVEYEKDEILAPVKKLQNALLGVGIFGILIAVFGSFLISRSIYIPVNRLNRAVNAMSRGEWDAILETGTKDEIGDLSRSFVKMSKELESHQRKLMDEKSYISSVLNSAGEGIIVVDQKGIVETFNRTAEVIFAYEAREVLYKNVTMLLPEKYRAEQIRRLERFDVDGQTKITGKEYVSMEGMCKDGRVFPMDLTINRVALAGDSRKIFIIMVRDITEIKNVKEEMEVIARIPMENPNPILRVTKEGKIVFANKASASLLEFWQCRVGGFLDKLWCDKVGKVFHEAIKQEEEISWDGAVMLLNIVPMADLGYVNIYGYDITERQTLMAKFHDSDMKFQLIVKAAVDGIITADNKGAIVQFNPAASKIFGYAPEEIIGESVRRLLPPDTDRGQFAKYLSSYRKAGEEKVFGASQEMIGRHKNGTLVPLDLSLSEIVKPSGERLYIGIIRDISERKKAEEEITRIMEVKDDFTSMVSHELRTPLAIAKEALSLVLRGKLGKVPGRQEEVIRMAGANIDRLGQLINDILDCHQGQRGKNDLDAGDGRYRWYRPRLRQRMAITCREKADNPDAQCPARAFDDLCRLGPVHADPREFNQQRGQIRPGVR